jgi:aminoglycoside phosphotransferase (APT) family kinase protein
MSTRLRPSSSADIRTALKELIRQRTGIGVHSLEGRPHAYRTSFPLEDLEVLLEDGRRLDLVFKNLGFDTLEEDARVAKASMLHDPLREIDTYRLLERADLGTPRLYGFLADPETDRYWLLLERIPGVPLWQVGERDVWEAAAEWLARMHEQFRGVHSLTADSLLIRDGRHMTEGMQRALGQATGRTRAMLVRIDAQYDEVIERLKHLPQTLIHGEFFPSNILVDLSLTPARIAPVDWEMAGTGTGLLDLASLVAGRWPEDDQIAIATAYEHARSGLDPDDEFFADLARCRLHNAVQLLGVSGKWSPPLDHAHDWATEAASAAEWLGIL